MVFADTKSADLDLLTLKARVNERIDQLIRSGAHIHIPRADRDYEVTVGLRMLTLRRIIEESSDGVLSIAPGEEPLIEYYSNSISHLLNISN